MKSIKILGIILSPFLIGWVSLFLGAYEISPILVLKILVNETLHIFNLGDIPEKTIIWDIRLPRMLMAFLVGASLASAGTTLQAIFRNPLVDPFILGISAGAAFGCAITIGFLKVLPIQFTAFFFGILAVFLACFIARTQGEISRLPLVLSGVIVSAFFQALVSIVKFLVDPHKLQSIVYWLMGSFSLADWQTMKWAFPGIMIGILPLLLMRWRLNVLSMGEEEAKMLGINVERERTLFIVFSTLAVATATSVCGIIGW
ncbi:MAG: iron transporter, partial [Thermodesulfobacterium geofontis]